jgi:hypothetical protein
MTGLPDGRTHPIYHPQREQVEALASVAERGLAPISTLGNGLRHILLL